MKIYKLMLLTGCVIALTACGHSTPKCGDSDVQKTVLKLMKDGVIAQIRAQYAPYRSANGTAEGSPHPSEVTALKEAESTSFSMGSIRTSETNKETGAVSCVASFTVNGNTFDAGYRVEVTDDGDEIRVTVL